MGRIILIAIACCPVIVGCAAPGARYVLEKPAGAKCEGTAVNAQIPPAPETVPSAAVEDTSRVSSDPPFPANPYHAESAKVSAGKLAMTTDAALPDLSDVIHWRTETTVPMVDSWGRPCAPGGAFAPLGESTKGHCVRVLKGPLIVTDLHSPGGCAGDLFAVGGNLSEPKWMMHVPAMTAMHVSGAVFALGERDFMVIGATALNESKIKGDVRCSITWTAWKQSGFGPNTSEARF